MIYVNGRSLDYKRPTISYKTACCLDLFGGPFITYKLPSGEEGKLEEGDVIAAIDGLKLTIVRNPDASAEEPC